MFSRHGRFAQLTQNQTQVIFRFKIVRINDFCRLQSLLRFLQISRLQVEIAQTPQCLGMLWLQCYRSLEMLDGLG